MVTQWSVRLGERVAISNHLLEQLSGWQTRATYQRTVGFSKMENRCLIYAPPSAYMSNLEPSSEPDPNLKATNVAEWMEQKVEAKGMLYQKNAAFYIRKYFGKKFVKINRNRNLAISEEVLKEFLARTRD